MRLRLPASVDRFDARADRAIERVRGHRATDALFQWASKAGDFSLVWHVVGAAYGLGIARDLGQTLLFSGLIGVESLVLNQGIKRLFQRERPTEHGDPRYPVRKPHTSSFPSGHASSACFAATLLTVWAAPAWAPVWFLIAAIVGFSRAFVRIHFASDVIAGALVGLALAQIALLTGAADLLR
jgi:membrane-associated phospholipid phosphatase